MKITELQDFLTKQMEPLEVLEVRDTQGYEVNNTTALWSDMPQGWSGSFLASDSKSYMWDLYKIDGDWQFQANSVDS